MSQAIGKHLWILLFSIAFLATDYFIDAGLKRVTGVSCALIFFYFIYKDLLGQRKSDRSKKIR